MSSSERSSAGGPIYPQGCTGASPRPKDNPTRPIQNDPVNHPSHYTNHPSGVECITVVEHMNFNLGNAMKYIWRAGEKGNLIEDLQKARWYLTRELQRLGAK